jgi:capsular polysaccharide biosynthesis protein
VQERPPFTLRDALIHRRLLVLAIVAVFVLAAGVLSLRPKTYEATALIYLDTSRTAPGFDLGIATGELLQHDFIVLATSRPVLQAVCASPNVTCSEADLVAPDAGLAKRIAVTVYKGTSSIAVSAKAPTAVEAAALANAVAAAMIDKDKAEVARLFKAPKDDIDKQLSDQRSAIDRQQQQIQQLQRLPPGSPVATAAQAELISLQAQYANTLIRQQDLVQQQDRLSNIATIQQSALPPLKPEAPDPVRYLLAALAAGLCLGVLAALLAERFDDRIYNAEGLARAASVPVALIARPPRGRRPLPEQGSYSLAFASLLAPARDGSPVLVTAASAADHSEVVADGLGAAAAHAGQRVVVVQSDGHGTDLNRFVARDVPGMTTINVPNGNGNGAAAAVADVQKKFEFGSSNIFIVVAVPSPDISPAAVQLGGTAKRAVIAATAGVTRVQDARRTADLLRRSGVDVAAGVLLTRRSGRASR